MLKCSARVHTRPVSTRACHIHVPLLAPPLRRLIIGFIAAFTVVLTYFTWRGCRRYRSQAKAQREREAAVAAAGGGPIELAAHPRVVASKADGLDLEHGVKPEDIDGYKDG